MFDQPVSFYDVFIRQLNQAGFAQMFQRPMKRGWRDMCHEPVRAYLAGFKQAVVATDVPARVVKVSFDPVEIFEAQILFHPDQEFAQFGEDRQLWRKGRWAVLHTVA